MKTTRKATIESLLKRHSGAAERIERASRFPLQQPVKVIIQTTDWSTERRSSKQYPGAASFVLPEFCTTLLIS
jgi:hypothetical protein